MGARKGWGKRVMWGSIAVEGGKSNDRDGDWPLAGECLFHFLGKYLPCAKRVVQCFGRWSKGDAGYGQARVYRPDQGWRGHIPYWLSEHLPESMAVPDSGLQWMSA